MTTPREIIDYLLPLLATAGRYTAEIQARIQSQEAKDGATIFHQALSDADLTVQSFVEVALLARFPEVSFFSEERAHSLNTKYFSADAALEVLLDPVDGTRSYIDNREHYQIIVAILDKTEMVGAIALMPRRDRCYIGLKGKGAFLLSLADIKNRIPWTPFHISSNVSGGASQESGPVMLFNAPEIQERLAPHMQTIDVLKHYIEEPGRYHFTDLLEGTAAATIHQPVQAIDGGAFAFIAELAGATISDFKGRAPGNYRLSPERILPNLIVSSSKEVHSKILAALK